MSPTATQPPPVGAEVIVSYYDSPAYPPLPVYHVVMMSPRPLAKMPE